MSYYKKVMEELRELKEEMAKMRATLDKLVAHMELKYNPGAGMYTTASHGYSFIGGGHSDFIGPGPGNTLDKKDGEGGVL